MGRVRSLPFDKPGRFYRGNLHAHSTRSDGRVEPAAVAAAYRDRGYDFLALTDHFLERFGFQVTDSRPLRTDGFTTLLGAELHGPKLENGDNWHIVAVGLPLDFSSGEGGEDGPSLVRRAAAAGAFVGIAHPAWVGVSPADALTLPEAHAIEIHNEGHARDSDRGNSWYLADLLAAGGHRRTAFAADDAHFGPRPDRFGGWVQVRAEALDPDLLLESLKAGHYYASTGPELRDIALRDGEIRVACSPAQAIHVTGHGATSRYVLGERLTEASFPLAPFRGRYCRVTVIDADGKRAWSNPIWLDDPDPDPVAG